MSTLETRLLSDSTSFALTADTWALGRGLLDSSGDPTSVFPSIIGVPNNSPDLGAFNIGIIVSNRTIKQAFQDLETAVDARMFAGNNLSDLPNKATARNNLELGSAATRAIGTSGATVPLLNTTNTWSGTQNLSAGATGTIFSVLGTNGTESGFYLTTSGSNRWGFLKNSVSETGSNAGSNLAIVRYADNGSVIDSPVSISRSTGIVTLSQPLPITSGGTGGNSLGAARTALNINNVDNTSDINKPVSTAQQTALNGKMDKTGGNLTGSLSSSSSIVTTSYIRAGDSLIVGGTSSEGGQIVIGYRNYPTITGEAAGTWNIDCDNNNNMRIFARKENNTGSGNIVTITESGEVSMTNLTVTGNNTIGRFVGSGGRYQGLTLRNMFGSSSQVATSYISFENENSFTNASIGIDAGTDGSSTISFGVTAPGSRNSDRRSYPLSISHTEISTSIPINGRAFPRRSDGTNINFIWTGQSSAPSWIIGSNNGTDFYPYSPSDTSVGKLSNIVGGDGGGYIRRSSDPNSNGNLSSQLILAGNTVTNDVWSGPLQIREVNKVGNSQTDSQYSPSITFHWGSTNAAAIKLHSDGSLRLQNQSSSVNYTTLYSGDYYTTGSVRFLNDGLIFWPGRNRGISVSDSGSNYGNITTTGAGNNGWSGYSIGTWAQFMANGSEVGIYSQDYGSWLLRFDSSRNAIFAQNVTAYSDERLKENKRPIDNIESRRSGMAKAAIAYERNGKSFVGFGAQTLEPFVPEVVNTSDDVVGTKTVDYASMVAILAVDNDRQAERIFQLEKENADLKALYCNILERLEKAGL